MYSAARCLCMNSCSVKMVSLLAVTSVHSSGSTKLDRRRVGVHTCIVRGTGAMRTWHWLPVTSGTTQHRQRTPTLGWRPHWLRTACTHGGRQGNSARRSCTCCTFVPCSSLLEQSEEPRGDIWAPNFGVLVAISGGPSGCCFTAAGAAARQ